MQEFSNSTIDRLHLKRVAAVGVLAALALGACQAGNVPSSQTSSTLPSMTTTAEALTPPHVTSKTTTVQSPESSSSPVTPTEHANTSSFVQGEKGCLPYFDAKVYTNHEYEVCTALVFNAELVALQGFYKYGNNNISYLSDPARHHFETRYFDQPRVDIENEVDSWPKTGKLKGNKVEEDIYVQSVSSSLALDRGFVSTQERWRVISPDGKTLLDTPPQNRAFTLCRGQQPGHPLHEWVVVKNQIDTNFDCLSFNQENGFGS